MPKRRSWLLPTLQGYRPSNLGWDVLAGLSAGAVVVPQAMAYATIANLPVQVGLYTCMVPMLVYALLGGSRAMSVSTTSTIATLTATTLVTAGVASTSTDPVGDLCMLTLLVGAMLLLARILRLGSVVEAINRSTIIGVQIGVGATVAVGQLPKLLGETDDFSGHGFIRSFVAVVEAIPNANLATTILSGCSIVVLLLIRRFARRVPGPLIVVVAGILLAAFTPLTDAGVKLIAEVPYGIPLPTLPTFAHIAGLVPGALAIAVMAFLESTAVARGIREPGEPQIDSNQELLATAVANVAGAFFQAMPSAGGFSQSAVNKNAGARSQVSGLVTVVLAILVAVLLAPVLSLLPQATLASLVFVAVIGLIDVKAILRLARLSRRDLWTAIVVAALGLTAGLLVAVAAGVVITFGLVIREITRVRTSEHGARDGMLAVSVESGMYTANILATENRLLELVDAARPLDTVVVDLGRMRVTSATVLDGLEDLDRELAGTGVRLVLAEVQSGARDLLDKSLWFRGLVDDGRVVPSIDAAFASRAASPSDSAQPKEPGTPDVARKPRGSDA
nr:SulP family inorganic anion transporter [Planctomonas sp. JC2975]